MSKQSSEDWWESSQKNKIIELDGHSVTSTCFSPGEGTALAGVACLSIPTISVKD